MLSQLASQSENHPSCWQANGSAIQSNIQPIKDSPYLLVGCMAGWFIGVF